uniref:Uncharacterized protein n=2 Tax=Equus TaxID=9789 RepID=A0A9L0S9B5_HORSE
MIILFRTLLNFLRGFHLFKEGAGFRWVATLDFPIALLETFELGPTLFQGPEEAILPEPLSHSPIHLAVSVTESSGLFIAPVHTCHLLILKAPVILLHPAASLSSGW